MSTPAGERHNGIRLPSEAIMPAVAPATRFPTFADVLRRLGDVPAERVRTFPPPGIATVKDLLDPKITGDRLYELVDGILVEKAVGWHEGGLALWIGSLLNLFLMEHNVGYAAGSDGMIRFKLDLVRMPDVSFIRWDSVDDPEEIENPDGAFLEVAPDFVVEIMSPSNTKREMEIKLEEYAKAGVKLAWYVYPKRREVEVYPDAHAEGKFTSGLVARSTAAPCCRGSCCRWRSCLRIARPPGRRVPGRRRSRRRGDAGGQHLRMTPASRPRIWMSWRVGSTTIGSIVAFIGWRKIWSFFRWYFLSVIARSTIATTLSPFSHVSRLRMTT